MFSTPEQLSVVTKASLEGRLAIIDAVTSKAFEGLEKVIDLNINTVKASLADSAEAARQLLTVKSPQEFFTLATQAQPNLEKFLAYGRLLADISSRTQAELLQVTREQMAESRDALIQPLAKPAPKKAVAPTLDKIAIAPKAASPIAKPAPKANKPVKAASEPAPAVAPKAVAAAKPKTAASKVKPAAVAATKPVATSAAEKPAVAAPAKAAAPAAKAAEDKPAVKAPAAASAAPAAAAAKPAPVVAQAAPASDKNTSPKK